MKTDNLLRRIPTYAAGLFVLAVGVVLSAKAQLGISPANSSPYVISEILNIKPGTGVIIFFSLLVLLQIVLLGKAFKPVNLLQIACSTLFGYFVNAVTSLFAGLSVSSYPLRLLLLAASILLIAVGVSLYLSAGLLPMPMEGVAGVLTQRLKIPFPRAKMFCDCGNVLIAVALSFTFLGKLMWVREGTIISALLVGPVMKLIQKLVRDPAERFCNSKPI